jgi:hypothetical protein
MTASKEEIREAMKILYNIDAENVDKALDSLAEEGLVEVKEEAQIVDRWS